MGVPKLFKFLAERYPCLVDLVKCDQTLDFDNLYLDMNGIIHQCANSNNLEFDFSLSEEVIYKQVFYYIEVLFNYIKPKKLLFLAVDGVAPQAKMNNQRSRRYKKAKEKETRLKNMLSKGKLPDFNIFDSNCISPGTVFMDHLDKQLEYFISSKLSSDPLWQKCKIIYSSHQVPGEGEHKIMDYIRYSKTLPDYDPFLKHCIFGSDADLMMLVLSTHEYNFFVLREKFEVSKMKKLLSIDELEFQLINIPFLRDYLDLEFQDLKENLPFPYDLDCIVDDWILMTFLLGNDFIPQLPDFHIHANAIPILYKTYKEVLPKLEGYLNENGFLNLSRFQEFMRSLSDYDTQVFEDESLIHAFSDDNITSIKEEDSMEENLDIDALIKLIQSTDIMFPNCNDEDFGKDGKKTFLEEFRQKKNNYYSNKLKLGEITDEVLKNQAKGYVRALQWNLFYYFHGCKSWDWFYCHHFSPYISDIAGFEDCSLDFELTEPLLPFQQLLAILPPSSYELVPEAYQHLMISSKSPIIDFYPETFEVELESYHCPWEGVSIIPFIDQKRLKAAMEPYTNLLTKEEKLRNRQKCNYLYTYTDQNLGTYKSPGYFPDLKANHSTRIEFKIECNNITKKSKSMHMSAAELSKMKCSTLRYFPYTGSLKRIGVMVFKYPSRQESLVLSLVPQETPSMGDLAKNLLGKSVRVNWPNLMKARVVCIASPKVIMTLHGDGTVQKEEMGEEMAQHWTNTQELLADYYLKKKGIEIGEVEIIVYVQKLDGWKYSFDESKKAMLNKIWTSTLTPWPLQTVVQNDVKETDQTIYSELKDAFPEGSTVFVLDKLYFGSKGKILNSLNCISKGYLNVAVEIVNDIQIKSDVLSDLQRKPTYFSRKAAATAVGISCRLLGRITGCLYVFKKSKKNSPEADEKINIGLKMKLPKRDDELPGYTKKENNFWVYSKKAIEIVSSYVKAFPKVVDYLAANLDSPIFYQNEIFGEDNDLMNDMVDWIGSQEHKKVNFITSDSEILEPDAVLKVEKLLSTFKKVISVKPMMIKVKNLYKSDLYFGKVLPFKSSKHCLLDRVVSIRSSYMVPTGLRGVIIGIHKMGTDEADIIYDILFDEPFMGGVQSYSSECRVYKMTDTHFLNLTDPNRTLPQVAAAKVEPVINQVEFPELLQFKDSSPTSAFAQWNPNRNKDPNYHCSQEVKILTRISEEKKENENDTFQKIWENLENGQPQQETIALRQLLKISDTNENRPDSGQQRKEQQDIVDSVKSFFQNLKVITPPISSESFDNFSPHPISFPNTPILRPPSHPFQDLSKSSKLFSKNPSALQLPFVSSSHLPTAPSKHLLIDSMVPPSSCSFTPTPQCSVPPTESLSDFQSLNDLQVPCPKSLMPQAFYSSQSAESKNSWNYFAQLHDYYNKKNLPSPKSSLFKTNNKFSAQLMCGDGKIFSGLLLDNKEAALQSAARNALVALGVISNNFNNQGNNHKIKNKHLNDNQTAIKKENKPNTKSVPAAPKAKTEFLKAEEIISKQLQNHKNNSESMKDNHRNLPQKLPPPPQQWMVSQIVWNSSFHGGTEYQGVPLVYSQPTKENTKNKIKENDHTSKSKSVKKINEPKSKTTESVLGFVPLQAITGKRVFKPIATTQSAVGLDKSSSDKIVKGPGTPSVIVHEVKEKSELCGTKPIMRKRRSRIAASLNLDRNP